MSKYTPGPWEANNTNRGYAEILSPETFISGIDGKTYHKTIARVYLRKSDARLIAAAPDLLECLCMAVKYLKGENMCSAMLPKFEAAIAKAEGRDA